MDGTFEEFLDDFHQKLNGFKEQENPQASDLFTRDLLNKLSALPQDHYQRFKDDMSIELYFSGTKLQGVPTEAKLDRMVTAMRSQVECESFETPRRLGDMLPDAPHPDMMVPSCWLLSDEGLCYAPDENTNTEVCDSPLYVASKIRDIERSEETLVIAIKVDEEWRRVYISASAGSNAIYKAIAGTGAMVDDIKALSSYIVGLRKINKALIPIEGQDVEYIFDRWTDYALANETKFLDGRWGRSSLIGGEKHLLVFPERLEQFLKKQGARLRPVLVAWKKKGLIHSEDGLLYSATIAGRRRRVVAFPQDVLGIDLDPNKERGDAIVI
jgi:hypothetical protein